MRYHTALFLVSVCIVIAGVMIVEPRVFGDPIGGVFGTLGQYNRDQAEAAKRRKETHEKERALRAERQNQEWMRQRKKREAKEKAARKKSAQSAAAYDKAVANIPRGRYGTWQLRVHRDHSLICPPKAGARWEFKNIQTDLIVAPIWSSMHDRLYKSMKDILWKKNGSKPWPKDTDFECLAIRTAKGDWSVITVILKRVK